MRSGYETLIILDRSLDMVTPFLTEFSYYGLIDNTFGVHFNRIYIEDHKVFLDKEKPDPNKKPCDNSQKNENKFKVCKNMDCTECPTRVWFDLATIFDAPPKDKSVTFAEWKEYSFRQVNKQIKKIMEILMKMENQQHTLGVSMDSIDFKIKFLDLKKYIIAHTAIAKTINDSLNQPNTQFALRLSQKIVGDFDESLMNKILSMADAEEPLYSVISLAILTTFVKSGLKASFLDNLTDKIFDNYGYKGTQVVLKLRSAGLLFVRDNNRDKTNPNDIGEFSIKKDQLELILEEENPSQDVKKLFY